MMISNLNKQQSDAIQMLRFPLIVLVVFVHMLPFEQQSIHWDGTGKDMYVMVTELISHHIGRVAVPCFFLFSGFFFFSKINKWTRRIYVEQLKKRVSTLVIPFIAWNILFILAVILKNLMFKSLGFSVDDGFVFLSEGTLYDFFWGMPINFPLWYLRDLIAMVLLAPIFYYFFTYLKIYGLLALMIIYLCVIESNIPGLSSTAFFYFGAGAYFGLTKKNMLAFALSLRQFSFLLALMMLCLTTYYTNTAVNEYLVRIFVLFAIPSLFYLVYKLQSFAKLKVRLIKLSSPVFFIYAIHMIYILSWLKGGLLKTPLANSTTGLLFGYFLIPVICLLVTLILFYGPNRYLPKTVSFLTGSRAN